MVSRDQIKGADYNPRGIAKGARKRLKAMLSRHGLVSTLVWNRRTGNLVSGHQRLSILDELEKSRDYALNVAVVDVDLAEEKKLNVQMNNPSMQGDWDIDALTAMIEDGSMNPFDLGFDEADVSVLFGGDSAFADLLEDDPEVAVAKDSLRKIKENRGEAVAKMEAEQNISNYFVVVCEDAEQRKALLKKLGVPSYEDYVNGRSLAAQLGA